MIYDYAKDLDLPLYIGYGALRRHGQTLMRLC